MIKGHAVYKQHTPLELCIKKLNYAFGSANHLT